MPVTTILTPLTVVLADRDVDTLDAGDRRLLADAAAGRDVVLVAPAGAVPGERWIVDLTARRAHAQERLDAWAAVLAPYARSVEAEIGESCPRRALANACHELRPAEAVALAPQTADAGRRTALLNRLLERAQPLARAAGRPARGDGSVSSA